MAAILPMFHHRCGENPLGDRLSRHYCDLVQIARSDVKARAVGDLALLEAVAAHKSVYFRAASAHYDRARPSTLRLSPGPELARALRTDYEGVSKMVFDAPEPFDQRMTSIAALESEANALA